MTLDDLLAKWLGKQGGAERANYQMFLTELTTALGLPTPDPKGQGLGDYQFEAPVRSAAALGTKGTGRIDLYRRDSFILEAKQSQVKPGEALPADPVPVALEPVYDLFGTPIGHQAPPGRTVPRYDRLMADARIQAEKYALALPGEHRAPPFLIVADIGRAFELYFDYTGNGRGYGFFPDQQSYRIALADLTMPAPVAGTRLSACELLRAIWTDPASVDPRLRAAEVTREIAQRLSRVAAHLEAEAKGGRADDVNLALGIEQTSLFLMRVLFCMFAEDVALLPRDSFQRFLSDAVERSAHFWRSGLTDLWSRMNDPAEVNRYWPHGDAIVRYFNGNLFADARVYDLAQEFRSELLVAARKDWRAVEPAIFGTLLEQVLTVTDRARLGAHYTPRAYVERLVAATIMDVLEPEWEAVRDTARTRHDAGDDAGAVRAIAAFHDRLADMRVLDPACGTGNFLYVAMEQLLRLEGEAIQLAAEMGAAFKPRIHPNQFLGLELNPRAAVIAELVLWIGWLRHRLANHPEAIGDPVLPTLTNINGGTHGGFDAVLARTATGEPDVENPRRPAWPEADFIVGNPPFIGGKDIRDRLGSVTAEALWRANPGVPKSADFVMHWWDRAADILTAPATRLRRFGFVTTNSITQKFSRRVIMRHLDASEGRARLSLTFAVPDHPWTRATTDAAGVRIAMTVAEAGEHPGRIEIVTETAGLDTDEPRIVTTLSTGSLNARLRLDDGLRDPTTLRSNLGMRARGVEFHADGYVLSAQEFGVMQAENPIFYEKYIKRYVDLDDYKRGRRERYVVDLFNLSEKEVRQSAPFLYDRLLTLAYPKRRRNSVRFRRENWWMLALPHIDLRDGLGSCENYLLTPITSRYRWFTRDVSAVMPNQDLLAIFTENWTDLGILSSSIHEEWFIEFCGWLGVGNDPRYNPTTVFDSFPFPSPTPDQRAAIADFAEELDATRRAALAEDERLTMTGLYNLVAAIRAGTLPPDREAQAVRARARIVAKLHDDLDVAVAAAYGWEWPLAPAEIVARLVALNAERAAEEAAGHVRWLRPDYQIPRFARASIAATKGD